MTIAGGFEALARKVRLKWEAGEQKDIAVLECSLQMLFAGLGAVGICLEYNKQNCPVVFQFDDGSVFDARTDRAIPHLAIVN